MSTSRRPNRREMIALSGAGAATVIGALAGRGLAQPPGGGEAGGAAQKAKKGAGTKRAKKPGETLKVPRRVLGKTGATIPILLFGSSFRLDRRFDPKLAEALRYGVDYIDTADCYNGGQCEISVASFHTRARARHRLWITSKSDRHDPDGFAETLATSLKKLKTDHVDMYYLHGLKNPDYLSRDLARTVARLKKSGAMKYFGFSCHNNNVAELLARAAELPWIDSVMFRYNFRQYGNKQLNQAMDAAHRAGVGLIAMKTQGSEASFRDAWKKFELTGKWNKYQAVLKAVWADPRITAAVSEMDTLGKLRQNIAAALDRTELGAVDRDALDRYARATRARACDGCDHICGGHVDAPVRIGDTMRYLMYHDAYDKPDQARALFRALPRAAQELSGVDFRAARAACPHGFDLVAHMERARKLFCA